jgi:hypothetical protein
MRPAWDWSWRRDDNISAHSQIDELVDECRT